MAAVPYPFFFLIFLGKHEYLTVARQGDMVLLWTTSTLKESQLFGDSLLSTLARLRKPHAIKILGNLLRLLVHLSVISLMADSSFSLLEFF